MVQGSNLVKERDSGKRKFNDMSVTEQQVLEDYETNKSAKRFKKECGKRLPLSAAKSCDFLSRPLPSLVLQCVSVV